MVGKLWVVCGAVLAAVAVVTGAMGTHLLKERLHVSQAELETFEVAVRYQMYHSFAIILVGLLAGRADGCALRAAGALFLIGLALFSGGLYGWLLTGIKPLVHVVPIGGTVWIIAWLALAWAALRSTPQKT
jgi:uncharacterized membrane protein YgdD (TMEM256/DUF423 family)